MAKFAGKIGYAETIETAQSVWEDRITPFPYYGDVISKNQKWENSQGVNDNTNINNRISIIADEKALKDFHLMRYVEWNGVKWKIINIDVRPPRLIISIGGVYNEK